VAPKVAQLLARHSDINLTMNSYTHLGLNDQAAALDSLPPLPRASSNEPQELRATGTEGARESGPYTGACTKLAQTPDAPCDGLTTDESGNVIGARFESRKKADPKPLSVVALENDCDRNDNW